MISELFVVVGNGVKQLFQFKRRLHVHLQKKIERLLISLRLTIKQETLHGTCSKKPLEASGQEHQMNQDLSYTLKHRIKVNQGYPLEGLRISKPPGDSNSTYLSLTKSLTFETGTTHGKQSLNRHWLLEREKLYLSQRLMEKIISKSYLN